ncbi:hypothetical protein DQE84_19010, partial [Staphylococcus warneri]
GIVLFLIVLWMIFSYLDGVFGSDLCAGGELFIVLFAILVLVGSSVFAMVMLMMLQAFGKMFEWVGVLMVMMIVCVIMLVL